MEREKKVRGFLPVCIQSKCSMSKRGFITTPEKRQPSHKHENVYVRHRQHNLAMLFCTTNYSSFLLRNASRDRWAEPKTKPCISQNVIHPMSLPLPVHLCDEFGEVTKTGKRVFIGVSGCQVQKRRILCQVLLNRQKIPRIKCQQKGNRKATFINAQKHRAGRKQLKWAYYVHPMLMKRTKAKGV